MSQYNGLPHILQVFTQMLSLPALNENAACLLPAPPGPLPLCSTSFPTVYKVQHITSFIYYVYGLLGSQLFPPLECKLQRGIVCFVQWCIPSVCNSAWHKVDAQ